MKKKFVIVWSIAAFILLIGMASAELEKVNPFLHYKFGVGVHISELFTDKNSYKPGNNVIISHTLLNKMESPIAEGKVRLQIFYNDEKYGEQMIDDFFSVANLNILTDGKNSDEYFYKLPSNAPNGKYSVKMYVQSDDYFNLAGLSFLPYGPPGAAAKITSFKVENPNSDSTLMFDKENTLLNSKPYDYLGIHPIFNGGNDFSISIPIINTGADKEVQIIAAAYNWDDSSESTLMPNSVTEQTTKITPNGRYTFNYDLKSLKEGVYQIKIQAHHGDEKAIVKIRFSISGEDARIYYHGISDFPIVSGKEITLFSTFGSSTDYFSSFNGSVEFLLTGNDGNLIFSDKTEQVFVPSPTGLKTKFVAGKDIDQAKLKVVLKNVKGNVLDERETVYDLSNFLDLGASLTILSDKETYNPGDNLGYEVRFQDPGGRNLKGDLVLYLLKGEDEIVNYQTIGIDGAAKGSFGLTGSGAYRLKAKETKTKAESEILINVKEPGSEKVEAPKQEEQKKQNGLNLVILIFSIILLAVFLIVVYVRKRTK